MQESDEKYEVFGSAGGNTRCRLTKSSDGTTTTWSTGTGIFLDPNWYYEHYLGPWKNYWNNYYVYPSLVDNTRKAFDVAKMLQEKKFINIRTIKQFTDLVDELMRVV